MPDDDHSPISATDAKQLFADWKAAPAIVLAVSGGPDSIALMWLAARWRRALARGPRLIAVTVDHGLRAEAAREARDVKRLARASICRIARCAGPAIKPKTGLPAAARAARYRLLAQAAPSAGRDAHSHRAYPRRSGRNAADAFAARQRHRRPCGDGAEIERDGVVLARPVSARLEIAAASRRLKRRRSALPTIRPTATSSSPGPGCAR